MTHMTNENDVFIVRDEATVFLRGSQVEHLTICLAELESGRWAWSTNARIGAAGHGRLPWIRDYHCDTKSQAITTALDELREYIDRLDKYNFGGKRSVPHARKAFEELTRQVTMDSLLGDNDAFKEVDGRKRDDSNHQPARQPTAADATKDKQSPGGRPRMKRINLDELPGVLRKCPPRGTVILRPLGGTDSNEMVVPSFSGRPMEYRASVIQQEDDWFGQCSCSGFTKLSKHEEPIKPCVHSGYLIREKLPLTEAEQEEASRSTLPKATGDGTTDDATDSGVHQKTPAENDIPPPPPPPPPIQIPEVVNADQPNPSDIETRSMWPSGLALVDACPGAAWGDADEVVVKTTGLPAVVGSCVHEIGKDMIDQKLPEVPDLIPYLVKYDLEEKRDDVFFPSLFLSQAWAGYKGAPGLSQYFPSPICEKKLEHSILATDPKTGRRIRFRFAGKADVLAFSAPTATEMPTAAAFIDWKSGYKDKALNPMVQMWTTAFIVAAQFKTIQTVRSSFVWLRDRKVITIEFTRDELRSLMEKFIMYKAFWDGRKYEKGKQCTYCTRLATCPGRMQLIASIAGGLTEATNASLSLITDENGQLRPTEVLARAVEEGRFLQKVLYSFFDELAIQLYESGVLKVPGEENKWVGVTERAGKTNIHMEKAWPILATIFEEDKIRSMSACSKSTLQNAIYEKTAYGQKKAAMASLLGQLDEAGAVTRSRNSRSVTILTDPAKAISAPKEGKS